MNMDRLTILPLLLILFGTLVYSETITSPIDSTLNDSTLTPLQKPFKRNVLRDSLQSLIKTFVKQDSLGQQKDTITNQESEVEDTSFCMWHYPFWRIGAGWEIGSMALFDLWEERLENTRLTSSIRAQLPLDTTKAIRTIEEPSFYYVTFPFYGAITPFVSEKGFLSLGVNFSWIRKYSKVSFELDSLGTIAYNDSLGTMEQRLAHVNLGFDIKYHIRINKLYFNVENVRESFLVIGLSGYPLSMVSQWKNLSFIPQTKDYNFGFGGGWYAGLSTIKRLSNKTGLDVGIIYSGSWMGQFRDKGNSISENYITGAPSSQGAKLQWLSHRFSFYVNLLMGNKKYRTQTTTKTSPHAPSLPQKRRRKQN